MALVKTAQGSLYYEVIDRVAPWEQQRDPILFHHGIGASAGIWTEWIAALADRHRIVTFDMRGYGRSVIPAADFGWSLELFIADVFAVADAVGIERFHLVGESIGGTIGFAATLARPERIATLTVSNGGHLGASIQRVDEWRRQLDKSGVKAWSDIFMRDRFHDGTLSPERWVWFAAQQEAWTRDSILNALAVLVGTDLSPRLPKFVVRYCCFTRMAAPLSRSRSRRRCTGFCPTPSSTSSAMRAMACPFRTGRPARRFCGLSSTPGIGNNPAITEETR
jgi:pimeloyl-ACP methyl ester carboxylesterase